MSDDETTTEKTDAPGFTDAENNQVFVFRYEDNSPRLFDPLGILGVVLSVLVTSIIFGLLWMMQ